MDWQLYDEYLRGHVIACIVMDAPNALISKTDIEHTFSPFTLKTIYIYVSHIMDSIIFKSVCLWAVQCLVIFFNDLALHYDDLSNSV